MNGRNRVHLFRFSYLRVDDAFRWVYNLVVKDWIYRFDVSLILSLSIEWFSLKRLCRSLYAVRTICFPVFARAGIYRY